MIKINTIPTYTRRFAGLDQYMIEEVFDRDLRPEIQYNFKKVVLTKGLEIWQRLFSVVDFSPILDFLAPRV
jgi:hypothetical protein